MSGGWTEVFDETYQAPYWWNEATGETTWDKPAALSAPPPPAAKKAAAAPAAAATEEISAEEYEQLLAAAGRAPSGAKPAAAKAQGGGSGGGGGIFGMFGGGGGGGASGASSGPIGAKAGLVSPQKPAAKKPAAAQRKAPQAAIFDDEDYLSELPPVGADQKAQMTSRAAAPVDPMQVVEYVNPEDAPKPAAEEPEPAVSASTAAQSGGGGGGGFFGGLFGGGGKPKTAKDFVPAALEGKEEVSEKELRELMEAAGKEQIKGYDLKIPPGRQAGYKGAVKEVALEDMKNLSPASLAAAPSSTGVTQLDGVKVTSIRKGDGRTFPQAGDVLTMHYVGKLRANKQVFDSSIARGPPFEFTIGQGTVIRGWDEGIMAMSLGEKAQLVIDADWAYGAAGKGPIPPNSDLVFDVDLLAINGMKAGGRFAGGN